MRIHGEKLQTILRSRKRSLRTVLSASGVSPNAFFTLKRKKEILPKSLLRVARELQVPPGSLLRDPSRPEFSAPAPVRKAVELLSAFAERQGAILFWFGSRAKEGGEERAHSDWDFGILGSSSSPVRELSAVKTEAEEAAWPYSIDFVDLRRAPRWFLRSIEGDAVPISGNLTRLVLSTVRGGEDEE